MKNSFDILLSRKASKFIKKSADLDKKQVNYILIALKEIRLNPYDSKPLKGKHVGKRRKRKDPYRIIFKIEKKSNEILILDIGNRSNIYK